MEIQSEKKSSKRPRKLFLDSDEEEEVQKEIESERISSG